MKRPELYETLKAELGQGAEQPHTIEVRLFAQQVSEHQDEMFNEVYVDGQLIETNGRTRDAQKAYMNARKAWRRAVTNVLNKNWPVPSEQ